MAARKKAAATAKKDWNQTQTVKRPRAASAKKTVRKTKRTAGKKSAGIGRYIILALLLAAGYRFGLTPLMGTVMAHPVFTVRNVTVEGLDYIEANDVIEAAAIETGMNIFEVDYLAVDERLEEAFAAEDFVVYKRLPDTVSIAIRERQPVALLNVNELIGVDAEGVPLPHIGASLVETLPIVTGIKSLKSLADSTVRERLITGLKLMGRISEESPSVYKRISEVNVNSMSDMGITLIDNGLEVVIGSDEWSRKVPMLETVIEKVNVGVDKVKAVDIRFKERVFIRK